jgi:hypothetical protein
MKHDAQERRLDLDPAVVVDKAQLPELVHEEVDAPACSPHDFGERFLRQSRHNPLRRAVLRSVPRQEQKRTGEPPFNRVEEMVDEIFFDADISLEHVCQELFVELGLRVQHLEHVPLVNHGDGARIQRDSGGDVDLLSGETSFSEKVPWLKHADDRLLAPRREHYKFHRSLLEIHHVTALGALRENDG